MSGWPNRNMSAHVPFCRQRNGVNVSHPLLGEWFTPSLPEVFLLIPPSLSALRLLEAKVPGEQHTLSLAN